MSLGTIDLEVTITDLDCAISETVKSIQYRIGQMFGQTDYEIAVIYHPCQKEYLPSEPFGVESVSDSNLSSDTVFVLCKSANGKEVIYPIDSDGAGNFERIDWGEYFCRVMLYTTGASSNRPGLVIEMPCLQGRIKVNGK